MGLLDPPPVVYYYLSQEGKRDPYDKHGPFDLDTMALLFREGILTRDTVMWTNERIKFVGMFRKQKVKGWLPIGHFPEEWQTLFRAAQARVRTRTVQQQPIQYMQAPQGSMFDAPPAYAQQAPPPGGYQQLNVSGGHQQQAAPGGYPQQQAAPGGYPQQAAPGGYPQQLPPGGQGGAFPQPPAGPYMPPSGQGPTPPTH